MTSIPLTVNLTVEQYYRATKMLETRLGRAAVDQDFVDFMIAALGDAVTAAEQAAAAAVTGAVPQSTGIRSF